ncbi:MAG: hypothetical protein RR740_00605 [Pseudomonas sp.]
MASHENACRARMFDRMTSTQAAAAKEELLKSQNTIARRMMALVGPHNLEAIKELAFAIKPHITRTMTPLQEAQWYGTGMDTEIMKEKLTGIIGKMIEDIKSAPMPSPEELVKLAELALQQPSCPPKVKAAAEELLRRHKQ